MYSIKYYGKNYIKIIYYINHCQTLYLQHVEAYIEIIINYKLYQMIVVNLVSRIKGNGKFLLNHVIQLAKINHLESITLDDMSKRYRMNDNIYIKSGFKYIYSEGPEMILNLN
jgi:hypothetical protein